jgi:hypothetical protein
MAIFKWITSPFTREEVQMTLTAYEQYWGTKMAVYSILLWWFSKNDIPEGQTTLSPGQYIALSKKILEPDQILVTEILNLLADKWNSFEAWAKTKTFLTFIRSSFLLFPNPSQDGQLPLYHRHFSEDAIVFLKQYLTEKARFTIIKNGII